jgi:uncharacterized membrane protein YqjE
MDLIENNAPHLADASKRLAQRAMVICENRIELLLLELEEQGERLMRLLWLGAALLVGTVLTGVALTLFVAVACWNWSPLAALGILTLVYAGATALIAGQLARLRRDWRVFPDTLDQLRKDRECLDKHLN